MSGVQTLSVTDDEHELRVDRWFKRHFPDLKHGRLEKLLRTGQIRVDGKRAKSNQRLEAGQAVRVPPLGEQPDLPPDDEPKVSQADAAMIRACVIHMDDDVIVLNKPPGLATQGGTGTTRHIDGMLEALRYDYPDKPRLVHRLDRDTSGVLVVGRTAKAASVLAAAFKSRDARKVYWAVVVGAPKLAEGKISAPIAKAPGKAGERMEVDEDWGKPAVTVYRTVESVSGKAAWLEMEPLTGRTHQLRVHAATMGTPILGDGKYGGAEAHLSGHGVSRKLHLHARALRLPHPRGGMLEVKAELPEHMAETFEFFAFDVAEAGDPFGEE
ncbi:RluA family pseudouridine synthase [Caenispirillum salinarum]|uniref:RluA family pseudouridine synthase n=1 Tax=Caenispirillum salinarum TaxID=859058 RepID=UPI00384F068D